MSTYPCPQCGTLLASTDTVCKTCGRRSIEPTQYASPSYLGSSMSGSSTVEPTQYASSSYPGYPPAPAAASNPYAGDPYNVPVPSQSSSGYSVPPPALYASDPYGASMGMGGQSAPGYSAPPVKKRGRRGLWITLGVIAAVLVLGILLLAVVGAKSTPNTTSTQASPSMPILTLNQYCNALKQVDYQTAYNQLSSDQHHQQTEAQFANHFNFLRVTDCAVSNVDATAGTGTISYTFSSGAQMVADYKLVKENNVWKIENEQARSTPTLTLSQYCNALKQGDYQTAYNQLSSSQQQQQTEAQFAANFNSPKLTNCTVSNVNDAAGTGTITYTFSNGAQVVADEKLVEENNAWKLDNEQVRK